MTRVPMGSSLQDVDWNKTLTSRYEIINQGLSAERIAENWGFTRRQLDEFSLETIIVHLKLKKKDDWIKKSCH
ncbi:hypothetical protein ACQKL0_17095 [Peribacillus sp. NPDC097264]|uniref:hypothetical protein n=1 Tax=Peribacillus sp. NPDC097264 TaxID=3390616 RepID=UPI003D0781EB